MRKGGVGGCSLNNSYHYVREIRFRTDHKVIWLRLSHLFFVFAKVSLGIIHVYQNIKVSEQYVMTYLTWVGNIGLHAS